MSANVIGAIVCIAMVICGMGCYFIGRTHGIEWASENMQIDLSRLDIHEATPEEAEELYRWMKGEREKDGDQKDGMGD